MAFDQRLNEQMPLDLQFKDESGQDVRLGDYFGHGKPVILVLGIFPLSDALFGSLQRPGAGDAATWT